MGRSLGYLAAHMKDFIKNGSQIKILKIPQILMKISKYSIFDHIYGSHYIRQYFGLTKGAKWLT